MSRSDAVEERWRARRDLRLQPLSMQTNTPKRVLMTADTVGGVWTYGLELAQALESHGIQIALATMGRALDDSQRRQIEATANIRLFESEYKLEWTENPWDDVREAGKWLIDIERRFAPDVIHLNSYAHGALPWRAPKLVVGHSCVLSWWRAVHGTDAPADLDLYREAVSAGIRAADLVVAPSRTMLSMLAQHYGPFGAWQIIHHGRKLDRPPRVPKEALVLTSGRLWDAAKNARVIESIAHDLQWPVYLAGEDRSEGSGQAYLPDSSLACNRSALTRLGPLAADEMATWFARASIYALPARYEPFGLSVLEAALSSCALVLGDIPSLRELWEGAALFVPPNDIEAFREAIQELIGSAAWRSRLSINARERAARYTPEIMAKGYMQAYAELGHASDFRKSFSSQTGPGLNPHPPAQDPRHLPRAA